MSGRGMPCVSVPVLSNSAISHSASRSSALPSLTSMPRLSSAPEATTCAAGTASPIAQGQVMINTAIAITSD